MKTNQLLIIFCGLLAGLLALIAPQPALAGGLHIHPVFVGGDPPPPSSIHGGGNLQAIFAVAAKKWEHVFREGPDSWDITIEFKWDDLSADGVAYAVEKLEEEGGTPVRPTRALVRFRNTETPNGYFDWYADPTPETNAEYEHYESVLAEVFDEDNNPIGELNVGRVFTTETGPAAGRLDLLEIATHEIGHALGLDFRYAGQIQQVPGNTLDFTSPLPFAGLFVFLRNGGTHLESYEATVVMTLNPAPGQRRLISGLDALAIAQLTSFEHPDLGEPPGVPKVKELEYCRLILGPPATQTPLVPDVAQ
jgi:hypothetical protein